MDSVTPLFNQTITEEIARGNMTFPLLPFVWHDLSNNSDLVQWPKASTDSHRTASTDAHRSTVSTSNLPLTTTDATVTSSTPIAALPTSATVKTTTTTPMPTTPTSDLTTAGTSQPTPDFITSTKSRPRTEATVTTHTITSRVTMTFPQPTLRRTTTSIQQLTKASHTEKPGCPWRRELLHQESEKEDLKETPEEELSWGRATISSVKLQPCVFELCKFYSQCVCRGFSHRAAALQRYCVDSHRWYERHTAEVCGRMRRITFSRNLKQKCLARMCVKM
nr:HERV-H LTR-associating protein 1 isoform X3 [Danio rerio]|eukprot:XP_009297019.1 HERV-H LTR-associating protein 1 isoform X3 [Danio rerio]